MCIYIYICNHDNDNDDMSVEVVLVTDPAWPAHPAGRAHLRLLIIEYDI